MSEWWTYRPSDFLLFSARTYHRLFETYNAAVWPAHVVVLAIAAVAGVALVRARPGAGAGLHRAVGGLLALAWLWVAWGYHQQRFMQINWAASGYAMAWGLQALVLVGVAAALRPVPAGSAGHARAPTVSRRRVGLGLWLCALAYPLAGFVFGRPVAQAEVVGLAPDPTAVATLGWLLLLRGETSRSSRWMRRAAWTLASTWCVLSSVTLATMKSPQTAVLASLAAAALLAALTRVSFRHSV